jgi:hypothetical protein
MKAASSLKASRLVALALPPSALLLAALASAPSTGCGGQRLPEPPAAIGLADPREGICVDFPPPAAKAEEIPPAPSARAVWIDGEWKWRLGRWIWRPGGWNEAPAASAWSRARLVREPNGALVWWPGRWLARSASSPAPPLPSCPPPAPPPPASASAAASAGLASASQIATPSLVDATFEDGGPAGAHTGPIRNFPADAPSTAPGRIELDAAIPSDADAPPALIQPPP